MKVGTKEYLGDFVYVEYTGYNNVRLTTENGLPTDPSNEIYLESEVAVALMNFIERIGWMMS